jgi:Tfp pilus assembly protein PilX
VDRDMSTPFSGLPGEQDNGAPLFRITALAKGNGGRASVALQSTYKVLNGF